jgi:anti-anti-sigma regulatory factor
VFKVSTEKTANGMVAHLVGIIDADSDLKKLIGKPEGATLTIDCGEVSRINSAGIRNWLRYFEYLVESGIKFEFENCPSVLIDQFNQISQFGRGGKVISMQLPYTCKTCEHEFTVAIQTEQLVNQNFNLPVHSCPKCQKDSHFDELADGYFWFLSRV